MGGANQVLAAQADEIVLVVIREPEHLVRHDVPDVDDEIPLLLHQHPVEHDRHRPVGRPLRRFIDKPARNLADFDASAAPVVGMNSLVRNRAEHLPVFLRRMRHMLPQRRNDVDVRLVRQQLVEHFRQPAGARSASA